MGSTLAVVLYLALHLAGVMYAIAMHGKARAPFHAGETLLASAVILALLWWAGSFDGVL